MTASTPRPRVVTLIEAAAVYGQLRAVNPWLPDPARVSIDPYSLDVTADGFSVLQLRVFIDLPTGWAEA